MAARKGTKGNDVFRSVAAGDAYDGVQGYDVVTYAGTSAVGIDLLRPAGNSGNARGDTYVRIDAFKLSRSDDVFLGSNTIDIANGDNGNDLLDGRDGNDALTGHSGNDTLIGGNGFDSLWGGGDNDTLLGGANNDQIWGDAANDVITGGTDSGSFSMAAIGGGQFFRVSANVLIPLNLIDDYGEWVVIPKYHAVEDASAVSSIGRADGDAIFVITNGYNFAHDWNAQRGPKSIPLINLGPGGVIGADTSIVFNTGSDTGNGAVKFSGAKVGLPGPQSANNTTNNVVTLTPTYSLSSVMFGDQLMGGSGSDIFIFAAGDGVDRIGDFSTAIDRIDIANTWFDGGILNGEFAVKDYAGGSLILFSDISVDGYVDNTAIYLAGLQASSVNASIFI